MKSRLHSASFFCLFFHPSLFSYSLLSPCAFFSTLLPLILVSVCIILCSLQFFPPMFLCHVRFLLRFSFLWFSSFALWFLLYSSVSNSVLCIVLCSLQFFPPMFLCHVRFLLPFSLLWVSSFALRFLLYSSVPNSVLCLYYSVFPAVFPSYVLMSCTFSFTLLSSLILSFPLMISSLRFCP